MLYDHHELAVAPNSLYMKTCIDCYRIICLLSKCSSWCPNQQNKLKMS